MLDVAGGCVSESSGCLLFSPGGGASVTICSSDRRVAVSTDGVYLYTVCELFPSLDVDLFADGMMPASPSLVETQYVVHRFSFLYNVCSGETTIHRTELVTFESASVPQRVEWPHVVMADLSRWLLPAN